MMSSTSRTDDHSTNVSDDEDDFFDDEADSGDSAASLSSDEDDDTELNPIWCDETAGLKTIPFTGVNEIRFNFAPDAKPIDYFNVLVSPILLEGIVRETNRYAQKNVTGANSGRLSSFKELDVAELQVFIGLLLHTGTIRMSRLQDYWKTHRLFGSNQSFAQYMSRDRFLSIMRWLHFSRNDENAEDRLHKIRSLLDHFNNTMNLIYYPGKELSLDEAMMLWRGRLCFRQYIKGKRHKYGLKFYILSEPNGLNLKLAVYAGKGDILSGKNHTAKVVLYLLREKLNRGHAVFMDNYYNSFSLSSQLLSKDTYTTGTLRADRKYNPKKVTQAKLNKGDTIAQYADGVMVGRWRDKRVVTYISTEYENELATFIQRRTNKESQKPLPIIKYNAFMKGVDRGDQLLSYYPCERKTLRWYKKVFIHILQMLVLNSFMLYNLNRGERQKIDIYNFRLRLIETLLPPKENPQLPLELPSTSRKRRSEAPAHTIEKNNDRDARNRLKRKRCRVCFRNGNKAMFTQYYCSDCPDKPGLCPKGCFAEYHNDK